MKYRAPFHLSLLFPASASAQSYRDRGPEDEVVYFLLPTRFERGDTANNQGGLTGERLKADFYLTAKGFCHGSDLKGRFKRLEYVPGLGSTAISVAPIFKHQAVSNESSRHHRHSITDFTMLVPYSGSDADFEALMNAAYGRRVKVNVDISTNHTADVIPHQKCVICTYRSKSDCPKNAYNPYIPKRLRNAKTPARWSDTSLYHNRGNLTFRGESALLGDFVELDKVKTEDPKTAAGFIDFADDGWTQGARNDMFASKVAACNDSVLSGTEATNAQLNSDPEHRLYKLLPQLSTRRQNHATQRHGKQIIRSYRDQLSLMAVSRPDPGTAREMLIVFNTSTVPLNANVEISRETTRFSSIFGTCPSLPREAGSAAVSIEPLDFIICEEGPKE